MRRSITRRNSSSSSSLTSSIDSSSNYQQSTPPLILSSSSSFDHQYLTSSSSSSFSSSSSSSSSSLVNYPPNFSDSNRIMKLSSDLSTDLKLGPGISTTTFHSPREELALMISAEGERNSTSSLFVKVKMEGIRIARKVDLLAHAGYPPLINTLEHMFPPPNILWAEGEQCSHRKYTHVLTYEDQEGDWMMVGDVPWEMFLATVKKLKITRIDTSPF